MYIKVIKLSFLFVGIIAFTVGSVFIGYLIFKPETHGGDTEPESMVLAAYDAGSDAEEDEVDEDEAGDEQPEPEHEAVRISDNTRIIYEYLAEGDEPEYREVSMPYYFLGMSEDNVGNVLIEGWSIKEFSEEIVVLSREVEKSEQDVYTLGVHNGYVAVYYNDRNVKETTGTPISTLSIDEQNRLMDGIVITGEEQLVKVLEDYGS